MFSDSSAFVIDFEGCAYGVSARRIFEHMMLGQINPFSRLVSSVQSPGEAAEVIDLIRGHPDSYSLTGLTLSALYDGSFTEEILGDDEAAVRENAGQATVKALVAEVVASAKKYTARRATRNSPLPLLPSGAREDPFGVPFLRSRLRDYLSTQLNTKAKAPQWIGTLKNLASKGLRNEELQRSGVLDFIDANAPNDNSLTGKVLAQSVDFSALRVSIMANINEARTQLRFESTPEKTLTKIRGGPKPQYGQQRQLCLFDRVMGYRIEQLDHPSLWGQERHWRAITFDGRVLRNPETQRAIFDSIEKAVARAQVHARMVMPKLMAAQNWVDWSWTGGENYREWLITLPFYSASYFSSHFDVRNVLSHVRCDVREGPAGEKILMLHEVQSDWMQDARRDSQDCGNGGGVDDEAPFINEWPALTLKLMLLHAAYLGVDALAWTRGAHQVSRYRGLGKEGLKELYDRTLPREAKRMLKPFGVISEALEVYVPNNFKIRRLESGFEVRGAEDDILGIAASFEDARALLPDGAHEQLYVVHGVRLSPATRGAILEKGFTAWG